METYTPTLVYCYKRENTLYQVDRHALAVDSDSNRDASVQLLGPFNAEQLWALEQCYGKPIQTTTWPIPPPKRIMVATGDCEGAFMYVPEDATDSDLHRMLSYGWKGPFGEEEASTVASAFERPSYDESHPTRALMLSSIDCKACDLLVRYPNGGSGWHDDDCAYIRSLPVNRDSDSDDESS